MHYETVLNLVWQPQHGVAIIGSQDTCVSSANFSFTDRSDTSYLSSVPAGASVMMPSFQTGQADDIIFQMQQIPNIGAPSYKKPPQNYKPTLKTASPMFSAAA